MALELKSVTEKIVPLSPLREVPKPGPVAPVPAVPAAKPESKATPARKRRKRKFGVMLSALLAIGLPVVVATLYYTFVAANQYVSEFKFAVRGAERPGGDALGGTGMGAAPAALLFDTFVVTDFINSRQVMQEVANEVDLRGVLGSPRGDFWTRMRAEAPVEEMHEHWRKMVRAHLDMLTGIVTVQVRAFSQDDAFKVANAIVARADEMFVKMTERARRDSLKFAETEVVRAEEAARVARAELREFREIQKVFDPNRNAQGNVELTNRLREELARLNMQVATMTTYLAPNAPQIQLLRTQIASLVQQIKQIEGSIGTDRDNNSGPVVPATLAKFEALTAAVQFAEKAHAAALDSLQRARAAADRRTTYLSVFVQPTMAEIALYPERPLAILLVGLAATAIWLIGLLGFSTVRDHLL